MRSATNTILNQGVKPLSEPTDESTMEARDLSPGAHTRWPDSTCAAQPQGAVPTHELL